jgi:hypothetical protein
MVSLAVPSNLSPLFPSDPRGEHLPLRTTGLWYPDLPPPSHHLHDDTFAGRQIPLQEYRPLVHIMFGGLKGHMLQYLTRISVTVSKTAIIGINFYYSDDAPVERLQACPATATHDYTAEIPFNIDGPAGERLTGIHADMDLFASAHGCSNYNYVASLKVSGADRRLCFMCRWSHTDYVLTKVTTDFKPVPFTFRPSAILQPRPRPPDPCNRQGSRKAEIAPGMTLTGIYFMHVGSQLMDDFLCQPTDVFSVDDQDPKFGMLSIGSIYQDLAASENGLHQSLEDEIRCRILG